MILHRDAFLSSRQAAPSYGPRGVFNSPLTPRHERKTSMPGFHRLESGIRGYPDLAGYSRCKAAGGTKSVPRYTALSTLVVTKMSGGTAMVQIWLGPGSLEVLGSGLLGEAFESVNVSIFQRYRYPKSPWASHLRDADHMTARVDSDSHKLIYRMCK